MQTNLYPEHEKLAAVSERSQIIGEFLDHCGYTLCEFRSAPILSDYDEFLPARKSLQEVLADYFGIDLEVIEREKRAMLDAIRAA